jgi:gliding motility-associated-like protein
MKIPLTALIILISLCSIQTSAQKSAHTWYFGKKAGIDFNSNPPVKLTNSALQTIEGTSCFSDPTTGAILFYTNGDSIWNKNHQPMPNGFGLGGHYSTTQSAVIIPDPGNNNRYYVFTVYAQANLYGPFCCGSGGLNYNIVDMNADNGLGDVIVKNQPLLSPTAEKLCAVQHCNGQDYWVVTHEWGTNKFYAYQVTPTGINSPVISNEGTIHQDAGSTNAWETIGYMRISPNGKMIASAISQEIKRVEVFPFDNNTGIVGDSLFSDSGFTNTCGTTGPYGVCFSPDNSRLYISNNVPGIGGSCTDISGIYQYDLTLNGAVALIASRTAIVTSNSTQYGALQIGPDQKIYVAKSSQAQLDVINNPNALGPACSYTANAFNLNTFSGPYQSQLGLPNFCETLLNPPLRCYLYFQGCLGLDSVLVLDTLLTPPYTFSWNFDDPASGASNFSTDQNPFHNYPSVGVYNVSLTINQECQNITITKPINTLGNFQVDAGPDTTICVGDNYIIPTSGGANYSWSPVDGLSCTDCANPLATPTVITTYIVSVSAPLPGCEDKDSVVITVLSTTELTVTPSTAVCSGDTLTLIADGAQTYVWSPGSGLSATNISNPLATITSNITYTVIGTFANCTPDTETITILLFPTPEVDAGEDVSIYENELAALNANSSANLFSWQPIVSLDNANINNPNASPVSTTTYTVTVTDNNGCTASDTVIVFVLPDDAFIYIPNAFSPNNDGINDKLEYFTKNITSLQFRIYNRWGQLLFESNVPGDFWNGIYKRLPQDIGVYVYEVVALTKGGNTLKQRGNFTLLR